MPHWALITLLLGAAPLPEAQALEAARSAHRDGDLRAARRALAKAARLVDEPAYGGRRRRQINRLGAEWARAESQFRSAARYELRSASTSLDDAKARKRHLRQAERDLQKAKASAAEIQSIKNLTEADAWLAAYVRRPRKREAQLSAALQQIRMAEGRYKRARHYAYRRWAQSVRALVRAASDPNGRRRVRRLTHNLRNSRRAPQVRTLAHRARFLAALSQKEQREAVVEGAQWSELAAQTLEPKKRRHARRPTFSRVCALYDAEVGKGACASLELATTGFSMFEDFSRGRVLDARGPDDMARTHEAHLVTLEACVLKLAKQDPDRLLGEELRFSWSITAAGRTTGIKVRPSRHAEAMAPCIAKSVLHFRYPRTKTDERDLVTVPLRLGLERSAAESEVP